MKWRRPLLVVMLALSGAGWAAPELQVTVTPTWLQLGDGAQGRLQVRGPAAMTGLRLVTNHGTLGPLRQVGEGRFEADFTPPREHFPRVALVAAVATLGDQPLHGVATLPLWGRGVAVVSTRPGARISLRIGARDFGPVKADLAGRGEVEVQVPPGTTHARHGARAIDLGLPAVSRVLVLAVPHEVAADQPAVVTLRVYSTSPTGALAPAQVTLRVPVGTVTALRPVAPGAAEATWSLPANEPGPLELSAAIAGTGATPMTTTIRVRAGPAVSLTLRAARQVYTAGAGVAVGLSLGARDAKARPTERPVVWETDFGAVVPLDGVPGLARAELRVPDAFEGRHQVRVRARVDGHEASVVLELEPGPAHALQLASPAPVRARETASVHGQILDAWGNVLNATPTISASTGDTRLTAVGDEGFVLHFTAPSTRLERAGELLVASGQLSARRPLLVVPQPALLTAAARAGVASNFAAITAPSASLELGAWRELAGRQVGLLLEGGALVATTGGADTSALAGSTVFVPFALSVALEVKLPGPLWLRPAVGGGATAVFNRLQLPGQSWVEERGLAGSAQASVQLGLRVGAGGPFLEVRGLAVFNPGLQSLQGSLFSLGLGAGYSFELL